VPRDRAVIQVISVKTFKTAAILFQGFVYLSTRHASGYIEKRIGNLMNSLLMSVIGIIPKRDNTSTGFEIHFLMK
jgi:hypothetical protein